MTTPVVSRTIGPRQLRKLKEIYESARAVRARYPESHIAGKAARDLMDAFETATGSIGAVHDDQWLSLTDPQGSA
jgi:hypothetical protein